jgi:hypothetical protein
MSRRKGKKRRFKSQRMEPGVTGFRGNQLMIGKLLEIGDQVRAKGLVMHRTQRR